MGTLGGNDQFTTMGQVTDILYIVIMKTEKTSYACHAILILKTGISVQNVPYYVQICRKLTKLLPF